MDNKNELGKLIKQRRAMMPMTLHELAASAGVSPSYLGRIERGERFPSGYILRKIASPLGFGESQLFTLAGFLSVQSSSMVESPGSGQLDPLVGSALSQEPVEIQRALLGITWILKSMIKSIAQQNSEMS